MRRISLELAVGHVPHVEEGGLRDLHHLLPVDALGMVRGLVIVGMAIRVIPYNRYAHAREGAVVATSDRVVPRPIVGC